MEEFKYKFTIFTPCYNSEKFINRVFKSVSSQTYTNFEWLIINDASTDNTLKIIESYKSEADFSIRIISNSENKMLYYNFNLAFKEAEGEFMIFAGHDDEFDPTTLERFNNIWEKHGNEHIAGIWCKCRNQHGLQVGIDFPDKITISNYFEMFTKYIYQQERFGCTRTDILRKFEFDINNNKVGEGFLWVWIGLNYQTIYSNEILRTYYTNDSTVNTALTNRNRSSVALPTYLQYVDWNNDYINRINCGIILKFRYAFALTFYGYIAGIPLSKTLKQIYNYKQLVKILVMVPFSFLYFKLKNR